MDLDRANELASEMIVNNKDQFGDLNIGIIHKDEINFITYTICVASLDNNYLDRSGISKENIKYIVAAIKLPHLPRDHSPIIELLDFLLNRSVFRQAYISKDVKEVLAQGYILLDCVNTDVRILHAALAYLRLLTEVQYKVEIFLELRKAGLDEMLALIFSYSYTISSDGELLYNGIHEHSVSWHNITPDGLAFLKRERFTGRTYIKSSHRGVPSELIRRFTDASPLRDTFNQLVKDAAREVKKDYMIFVRDINTEQRKGLRLDKLPAVVTQFNKERMT